MGTSSKKTAYSDRTDLEKIFSNWNKIRGLLKRGEWSSAIVRAATATEIAANLVIREELVDGYGLPKPLVDHFLLWANGIRGKFEKLILPVTNGKTHNAELIKLKKRVDDINKERNSIVHTGAFKSEAKAHQIVNEARSVILALVAIYYDGFELDKP